MGHCSWANINETEKNYHDNEWGIPVHDDRHMFEHLTLECLQCGLSWDLMMKKREIFRECFCNFEYERIAQFDDSDIQRILSKITLVGAFFLGVIAIFPIIFGAITKVNIAMGGTSILIVVSVALETARTMESQMIARHHKGFLE